MSASRPSNRLLTGIVVVGAFVVTGTPLLGQSEESLSPGDVVRIDHEFVGTLMSIDNATVLTVLGEGKQLCWPGIGHGDAPRCDPAPAVRRVVDWRGSTVERQLVEQSHTKGMVLGFLIGAAVGVPFGYLTGPSLGYGKVDQCVEVSLTQLCTNSIRREEFDRLQRAQDQRRGAFFLGVVGATAGTIVARRMAAEWLQVTPPAPNGVESPWSVGVRVSLPNR